MFFFLRGRRGWVLNFFFPIACAHEQECVRVVSFFLPPLCRFRLVSHSGARLAQCMPLPAEPSLVLNLLSSCLNLQVVGLQVCATTPDSGCLLSSVWYRGWHSGPYACLTYRATPYPWFWEPGWQGWYVPPHPACFVLFNFGFVFTVRDIDLNLGARERSAFSQ